MSTSLDSVPTPDYSYITDSSVLTGIGIGIGLIITLTLLVRGVLRWPKGQAYKGVIAIIIGIYIGMVSDFGKRVKKFGEKHDD